MGKVRNKKSKLPPKAGGISLHKRNEINEIVRKILKITSQIPSDNRANFESHVEIDKLLRRVQEIEPGFEVNRNREDHFPGLIKWIKENGGVTDNVTINKFDQMEYGLEAVSDLNEGDLVCSVPRELMMTLDNVQNSPLKYLYQNDPILKDMGNVALALFLILEYLKGESSFWYLYISSLPFRYNTVLYFSLDDFSELKCSPTFDPAVKHCKYIARQYAYFNNLFQSSTDEASQILKNTFTYQLYRWAVSTVMTRQNFLPSKEDSSLCINGLIPLWDMCNHGSGYLSTQYKADRSECLAYKSFKKGEQVLIYYGKRSNADFFIHNGFTHEENEEDSFRLFLGVSKADRLHDEKCEVLKGLGIPTSGDFYIHSGSNPVRDQLLAFVRVFNMESGELSRWKSSNRLKDLMWNDCALDTKLESKVWNFLYNRIKIFLTRYKDVAHEVDGPPPTECTLLVRALLSLEKKFLENALEHVRQRIKA